MSPIAQRRYNFTVTRLPDHSPQDASLLAEALRDNTRSAPGEQAAFRHDFPLWLSRFGPRHCRIALDMALGHRTLDLAHFYGRSPARISQLRREFHQDWRYFTGEVAVGNATTGVVRA
jgi:hypothetical protein